MSFDPTKPVMPTCGGEAIIHSTSGPYITNTGVRMPIVASFKTPDGLWDVSWFRADGGYCGDNSSHRYDLINIPEEKWRPWTWDEVPVGALLRTRKRSWTALIAASGPDHLVVGNNKWNHSITFWDKLEHSTDLGKTWQPAGVKIQ